jgi:AraC-like DNA-binding protein
MTSAGPAAPDFLSQVWAEASVTLIRAGSYLYQERWVMHDRTLPHHQLWLITGGRAAITAGVRQFAVHTGSALLVPPHVPHRGVSDAALPFRCYVLHYTVRVLGAAVPDALQSLPASLRARPEVWHTMLSCAAEAYREQRASGPGAPLLANAAVTRLLGLYWREATRSAGETAPNAVAGLGAAAPRLGQVLAYIATHFRERVTLRDLSALVHLSPTHFSTVFHQATGLAPLQYLNRYRAQRAKELLGNGTASVAEVAAAVGFADPYYFSRVFKRCEGVSPRQYRNARLHLERL